MKREMTSFIMYHSFSTPFGLLDMEQKGQLINAIFEYEMEGKLNSELSEVVNMAFMCIKDTLDRDRASYKEKCDINRENGKKGGRPPKAGKENAREDGGEVPYAEEQAEAWGGDTGVYDAEPFVDNAPRLTQEQQSRLTREGVEQQYVDVRLDRAWEYAKIRGRDVTDVLAEWWCKDAKRKRGYVKKPQTQSEYTAQVRVGAESAAAPVQDKYTSDPLLREWMHRWGDDI